MEASKRSALGDITNVDLSGRYERLDDIKENEAYKNDSPMEKFANVNVNRGIQKASMADLKNDSPVLNMEKFANVNVNRGIQEAPRAVFKADSSSSVCGIDKFAKVNFKRGVH